MAGRFPQFFKAATGHAPFDYQRRLAGCGIAAGILTSLLGVAPDLRCR